MKINIPVDAAYAFDMLSILQVKKDFENFKELATCISDQIGKEIYYEVVASDEYFDLYKTNKDIFEALDGITDKTAAKDIHLLNMRRHSHKRSIQETFFDSKLSELKI